MVKFRVKGLFFNSAEIMRAVDKATRKTLSHFGGFVRLVARRSIRRRKSVSAPGRPPHSHSGLLKKGIFYSYSRARESVVIGPEFRAKPTVAGKTIPELLEEGGTWVKKIKLKSGKKKKVRRTMQARPYMRPAFVAGRKVLPSKLKNSIKK